MPNRQLLDRVLKFYYDGKDPYNITHAQNHFHSFGETIEKKVLSIVVRKLIHDQHLVAVGDGSHYQITFEGLTFHEIGGYEKQHLRQQAKQHYDIKRKKIERELKETSIDVNKSIRRTNDLQKGILIFTALISTSSLVVSVMDYNKDDAPRINVTPAPVQILTPKLESKQGTQAKSTSSGLKDSTP